MFVEESDLKDVMKCKGEYEQVARAVKRMVEASCTAKSLFKSALLSATRALFVIEIQDMLQRVEHRACLATDIASVS